jgi:exonuclease SbcD
VQACVVRLLHTSDWHLGRTLHGQNLDEFHTSFLDWLVDTAQEQQVDAVLVAGDIYDRGIPPAGAVQLLDNVLSQFAKARIPVVLIAGNHDSPTRLGFGGQLTEAAGVHLRTTVDDLTRPVVLEDEHGPVGVYGIPYLFPSVETDRLGADRTHESVLGAAVGVIRADARDRGISRSVVLAHAFITGGQSSQSERELRAGGVSDCAAGVFTGIDYVALGHLHGPQAVTGPNETTIRYSGSPLAYSFSEKDHKKSVTVVEIGAIGQVKTEQLPTPVARPMREVTGELAELVAKGHGPLAELADAWVKAIITDSVHPTAPIQRLREVWPHTLALEFKPATPTVSTSDDLARLAKADSPQQICELWVDFVRGETALPEQVDAIQRAIEHAAQRERLG